MNAVCVCACVCVECRNMNSAVVDIVLSKLCVSIYVSVNESNM